MANRIKFTPKKQADFLERIAGGWSITDGAKAAGVSTRTIYDHKAADVAFAAALEDALECGSDVLEDEARRRAVDGVTKAKGVYHQGERVDTYIETEYSDTLLIFLLKARRPAKFRDNVNLQHTGLDGAPLALKHEFDYVGYSAAFAQFASGRATELTLVGTDGVDESLDSARADAPASLLPDGPAA